MYLCVLPLLINLCVLPLPTYLCMLPLPMVTAFLPRVLPWLPGMVAPRLPLAARLLGTVLTLQGRCRWVGRWHGGGGRLQKMGTPEMRQIIFVRTKSDFN